MPIGKAEDALNLALDVSETTREKSSNLGVGYFPATNTWELIVKYSGSLDRIREELNISAVELFDEYAIIIIPENLINTLAQYEEIEFIEKPKRISFEVNQGRTVSCINPVQSGVYNLFGEGVYVGIIDSGIDYSHPDFRNEDGTTRIAALWDQTIAGNPPQGYDIGTLYTREQINEALATPMPQRMDIVPSSDSSGHGTHVAGIAAGNGRASEGRYRGVASQSELVVVKLGSSVGDSFPRTTQLMQGIDFAIRYALHAGKPIAINISFGNNYGSHTGNSLLESYINDAANLWKNSIVIGTGNEGAAGNHAHGILRMGEPAVIEFAVSDFEFSLNLQIWKNYYDDFDDFRKVIKGKQVFISSTKEKSRFYTDVQYTDDCYIIFGKETAGLPDYIHKEFINSRIKIPMIDNVHARSLNLANSVNIVMYEALRQLDFPRMI